MSLTTLEKFLEDFDSIEEQEIKFQALIEISDRFKEVPQEVATRPFERSHLVPGCESEAYVFKKQSGTESPHFYFAVENPQGISAKALAAILTEHLNGSTSEEIKNLNPEIVYKIFGKSLSMGKGQGLMNMINFVKALA